MDPGSQHFQIKGNREELFSSLRDYFSLQVEKPKQRRVVYLDTFDWRFYRKRKFLRLIESGREKNRLELTGFNGNVDACLGVDSAPEFAWNLPPSWIRSMFQTIASVRRLFPAAGVTMSGRLLRILNRRQKTVVRVEWNEWSQVWIWENGREKAIRFPHDFLIVSAVRGYDKDFREVTGFLKNRLEPLPDDWNELEVLLGAAGKNPADFSSKPDLRLDPKLSGFDATKAILGLMLSTMKATEEGTRRNLDSEFLHDFRVAVRRTRSILGQIKGVFTPLQIESFKREFSWLGKVTGPTRDLDVYLLKFNTYRARLPESIGEDLDPLLDFLKARHQIEHAALAKTLRGSRYRRLIRNWETFLSESEPHESSPNADQPIFDLASRRIRRVLKKIISEGEKIDDQTPAELIHRIRIDCKKLRYLVEFFRSLYLSREIQKLIKALRRLQDHLGDFNDYEVQQIRLKQYAHEMQGMGHTDPDVFLAMGRLMQQLSIDQKNERALIKDQFEAFATAENRNRFQRLFKTRGAGSVRA